METVGAYGGGKAGGVFDPLAFIKRPQVILRASCWLFAIIVFGCISSQGWLYDTTTKKEECLYNKDSNACNFGVGIAVLAFLASMGFLGGEYLFEQMSSVKTRKHYVLADLGFSGFWSFLYFVAFWYLASQWGKSDTPPKNYGVNNVQAAIAFSFFSIFTWAGCAFLHSNVFVKELMLLLHPATKLITLYRLPIHRTQVDPILISITKNLHFRGFKPKRH